MILYGSRLSPYVRKVLFCAAEKGIDMEVRDARGSGAEFAAVSPFGKMPALRDGDFSISDSSAIVAYLDDRGRALIPAEAQNRARAVWFDEYADTLLIPCITKIFWQRFVNPVLMGKGGDEELARQAEGEELPPLLAYLELVAPQQGYLLGGGEPTLADIAVMSGLLAYIGYCGAGIDEAAFPRVAGLVERFRARPAIAAVLAREAEARRAMEQATA